MLGLAMGMVEAPDILHAVRAEKSAVSAHLVLEPPKPRPAPPKPAPRPRPVVEKKKTPVEPVDLPKKPLMNQKTEDNQPQPAKDSRPVRRVYGLRKVYSTGIGAGGNMSDAVVGKLGNTTDKDYDTLQATEEEIRGRIVSTTTVTTPPRYRKRVKPEYTETMLTERTEGVVKVRVLIDIDGKVKKAEALNDIGADAVSQAVKATMAMEFDPARRGTEPVAVWIIVPIRFVVLG
jgi:TonB family protein